VTLAQGPGTFPLFGSLPAGSTGQERLNLGRVDIHGFQLGAKWEASRTLSLEVSAVGESTAVEAAPVEPDLVGKALPEVPRWNSSLGLAWRPTASLSLSLRARWSSSEFDDDLNQLPLASYCSVDASLRYAFAKHAEVFDRRRPASSISWSRCCGPSGSRKFSAMNNPNAWLQLALYVGALLLITKPLGLYLVQVLDAQGRTWLDRW
jgi:outer membrane receptor protein involved in Fe transport